jgi:hypothetical protein
MNARKTVIRFAAFAATVFCGPAALFAAEVAPADALRAAQTWVSLGRSMGKLSADRAVAAVDEIEDPATGARLLVARFEGGGFVVMSADDLVDPVISFSATGDGVVVDDSNPYWTLLRGDIAAREAAAGVVRGSAASSGTPPSRLLAAVAPSARTAAQRKWAELLGESGSGSRAAGAALLRAAVPGSAPEDLRVDSFVASSWHQSTHNNYADGQNCYNYYTPKNYVCGCVATVGAQIMRYWQYPTATVAPRTVGCAVDGVSADYTMMGGVYDWASMPLVPSDGVMETQCQAIGKLTYDIGVSVGMKWKSGGSSSSCYELARQLPAVFGYATASAACYIDGYYAYSIDEVKKAVIPNCDARAPVAMSIERVENGSTYGHAVLVDGYGYSADDFYMHVNFGWGGDSDAWYMPPDIKNYSTIKGFVFNVFPTSTGSILSGRVLDASGAPIAGAPVTLKRNATTVGTTTTDAHGIYAFVAAAGSYLVSAAAGGESAVVGAEVAETVGTRLAENIGYYNYSTASIGNSYGNDIRITGIAGAAPPVFSPDSCLFYPSTNVAITCADAGAEIRYTLDGSEPDAASALYTGPIFVDDTVTIKARAFAAGMNPSPVVGATYTYDAAQGAPKGDYFDNPINISDASGSYVIDDNSAYTTEDGEPWHTLENYSYCDQYHTVWYKWTAPGSGTMTIETECSGGGWIYPTYIAVYTGDTLTLDNRQAFTNVYDTDTYITTLAFEVEQGVTYRIVGMLGYDGSGTFTLSWSGDLTVAQSPYETWAAAKGLGAPGEVTAGVENVFRYVFGKPTEAFSPIASVGRNASGRIVLALPAVVNTEGVTLSVLSTPDITNWSPPVAEERSLTLGADGAVRFEDFDSVRFYRLKAEVQAP